MNKEQALEKVDRFLMDNHHHAKIKIMTGKGSGILHKAVVNYLKMGHYPWTYEKMKNGNTNHGVLVVHLNE
jgi:DNA-nicking Smr family endonuclease